MPQHMDRLRSGDYKSYGEMMKRIGSKGAIFTSLFVMLAIYLFAVSLVIIFFYFFKFHITIIMIDEYRWNKVQEVPLSLLSMDVDGEQVVSKINKVYYGFESEDQLDEVKGLVNKQLYYMYGGSQPNMGYSFSVGGASVTESPFPTCGCNYGWNGATFSFDWHCGGGCPNDGETCYHWMYDPYAGQNVQVPDETMCYVIGRIEYHGSYPFPLTFNGTYKFIETMSYDAVEYK